MEIGGPFAFCGPLATRDNLATMARRVEDLGFDFVWMGEHIYYPTQMKAKYPYTADGRLPINPTHNYFEITATLAFVAALTTRLKLHTSILMPALRSPYLAAKQLATIDYFSNGRLNVGLGLGWMTDEYDLMGVPWKERGKYLDEWIVAIRAYMAGQAFRGKFFNFEEGFFQPKPSQTPMPFWIGGDSDAAVNRAAVLGQGWRPVGPADIDAKCLWLKERIARIGEIRAARGESMAGFGLSAPCGELKVNEGAAILRVAKSQLMDNLGKLAQAGATHVTVHFNDLNAPELQPVLDEAQWVSEEILPFAKGL